MDDELADIIKRLEEKKGIPIQLRIESPDRDMSWKPLEKEVNMEAYGSFLHRPCEVIPISPKPNKYVPDEEHKHAMELLRGRYDSFSDLIDRVKKASFIDSIGHHRIRSSVPEELFYFLNEQYGITKDVLIDEGKEPYRKELAIPITLARFFHGVQKGGPFDQFHENSKSIEFKFEHTRRTMKPIFNRAINFCRENNIPFFYHPLLADISGIYEKSPEGHSGRYGHKVANVKFDFLNGQKNTK